MTQKRIALIGLGMAAAPHARSLLDLADRVAVAAVFSPSAARRDAFSTSWGFAPVDCMEVIWNDPSIDAVVILTPPNTHLDLVRQAADAGKHILLEKPLETSFERSVELVETAENAGVKLGVVLQHRFRPASAALKEIVDSGRLGSLVSASARLYNWRPQSYYDEPGRGTRNRDGGGVLLTQAIHTLDLMIGLVGVPLEVTAYATTSPVHSMETEDLAVAAVRFDNGALGTITATTAAFPGYPDAIDVIGAKGTARLDGAHLTVNFHDGSHVTATDISEGGGAGADPMAFSHHHHRAVLADFLDAIDNNRAPLVSGREALKVHRMIEAMLRSAQSGKREAVR
ncbi:gfo/Idh/MocA family oxidoreductase [Mesorhizobium sp. NBSH29]|uniref:Gfo/Idh/MocA family protein n=1 Tax=Mesorhizobium sp. NBSH29 TaxID=2654249 RepID=UPI00189663BE|nr:Gfo/Idh/MocA family oxidoreductase [Mesorhizobium sp. NBSH29]QPC86925.1 gfo/Idh/MocA family oxidoreductase [Mesorhizobium sp. NBSH29]